MKDLKNNNTWYGFMEDQVFSEIMSDPKICKYILQTILPEIKINKIYLPDKQKEVKDPEHRSQKDIRLDILVEDYNHNLYNLEAQTTDKHDIGWRMCYYACKLDQRVTLNKGKTYRDLKNTYIIFLCTYDPKGRGKIKYEYQNTEKTDPTDKLNDGLEKIIINAKGIPNKESKDLLALVDLMINKPIHLNKYFDKIQAKIKEINDDPKWRDKIT